MKRFFKILFKYIIIPIFVLIIIGLIVIFTYHAYITSESEKINKIVSPKGIDSIEKHSINGIDQWIYIRGENKSNPLLLFVHGGPGSPEMPLAKKKYQGVMEKHYVIIHWDQRGAGKSYSGKVFDSTLSVDTYVNDAIFLTKLLLKRFNKQKLYILGHSWGSIVSIYAVQRHPELFHAYYSVGQVVNIKESEKISYEYVVNKAKESKNKKAIRELNEIGPPPYKGSLKNIMIQRQWLGNFRGFMYKYSDPFQVLGDEFSTFSKYSLLDATYRFFLGGYFTLTKLWKEMITQDMFQRVSELKVPVYFLTGKHDYTTASSLIEKYYNYLKAPYKDLIWFEKSAHFPNIEEPVRFQKKLIEILKNSPEK